VRAALSTIEVVRPRDLSQALRALRTLNGEERPTPLAGGTDLFVYLNAGSHPGRRFLDLWGLDELRGIRVRSTGVTIGALTTFTQIRMHPVVRRRFPCLTAAAAEIGARPIQNRATLAGNMANASPAGDSLPALMALEAEVLVRSTRGQRTITFAEFYRGYRDTALEPDELITSIALPFPPPRTVQFFRKVGTRRAQSIAKVVMAAVFTTDRKRRPAAVRIALGSVAPVTLRARRTEEALLAGPPSPASAARGRAALREDIAPIDDIRSDREYRSAVAANLLDQFLRVADSRFDGRGRA
jgi:CO/xanthine dehydrogenase FAD-binding subunit